ncbi:hypothetical protein CCZ01_08100 [Helicobacter monodelphidis]|uniref:hypothetical protein n=1 Tax=Helicobacter sp. 15-1451 TaxID=2004995 RepID=UPI000DCECA98|nr:hypothetical protein [Helicobacter sp. 15-1451]RAX56892.1 hypothetical protein CCZ01_08100 [Helicobacter sp. 15-1451]
MNVIPFTMVAFEQDLTKTYLEVLYEADLAFEKIIVLPHPRWFGQHQEWINERKNDLLQVNAVIAEQLPIKVPYFSRCDFSKYSPLVEVVDEFSFWPDGLLERINPSKKYFFSYVRLCPPKFLQKAKWFHVHPGIIPPIRGHGLFWSLLVGSAPGYSLFSFNENAGIDNGCVVYQNEFLEEKLPNLSALRHIHLDNLVYGIMQYYDNYLRAKLLVEYFKNHQQEKIYTQEQKIKFGHSDRIFFAAHMNLVKFVLKKYFNCFMD